MSLADEFVHLHIHSEYSLLDGSIRIKKLVKELAARGATAAALTDHDAMHGLLEFYLEAQGANINGIIGLEANVAYFTQGVSTRPSHLVLLAENEAGYRNLIKLCTFANTEGKHLCGNETVSLPWNILSTHTEGLICLTSCEKGELATLVTDKKLNEARHFLTHLKTVFGENHVFVELIDNNLASQKILIPKLVNIANECQLPIVATADVHYLHKKDRDTHLSLLAIKQKLNRNDLKGIDKTYEFHLATADEMKVKFAEYPEAISNTVKIAERCKVKINTKNVYMPNFELKNNESMDDGMARLSREGLLERRSTIEAAYGASFNEELWKSYEERLEYELTVINKMNFAGYFLIVQDFINWAKSKLIPVGPGRGSAAGSLVTYALKITDIDPIRFNLLFERFLNPERISMPDIDTDFCQDRRGEVLNYVYERYGQGAVCQIVTFGRLMARNAIKNLARISGWNFNDSNDFAKLIPEGAGMTLEKALEENPLLKQRLASDERASDLWTDSLEIEGILNSLGIHAAGVIISDSSLGERCPLMESEGQYLTQLEHKYAEKIGLIKFDFLGLKTLTVIEKAVQMIRKRYNNNFDINTIELEDSNVYKMISTAHVTGVFQLESGGMRKLIADLKPTCFMDIVAVLALFRPGPLGSGMVEDFVLRKHGKAAIEYVVPELEPILKETYGIVVFQEQVQKIAADLANYTLGEADLLRRAMGKKDKNEMEKQKARFVSGAISNGFDAKAMSDLFDLMAKFAEYGFNKSHTVAYGLVTYQTAFLKTYYPTEFMAAIMSCDLEDTDKIVNYVRDCKRMKIQVHPPDVNASFYEFSVPQDKTIQFGMGAIKGLGKGIIELIVEERESGGTFRTVPEFIARVDARKLNKKFLESLIKSGAFDKLEKNRAWLMVNTDQWMRSISKEQETNDATSVMLFDFGGAEAGSTGRDVSHLISSIRSTETKQWSLWTRLEHEHNTLGFYISGHPTDMIRQDLEQLSQSRIESLASHIEPDNVPEHKRKPVRIAGLITDVFEKRTKENEPFCILRIEDGTADVEVAIFPKQYAALLQKYAKGQNVWVDCKIRRGIEEGSVKASCVAIGRIADKRVELTKKIVLNASEQFVRSGAEVDRLKNLLEKHRGNTPVSLEVALHHEKVKLQAKFDNHPILPSDEFIQALEEMWPGQMVVKRWYGPVIGTSRNPES